MAAKIERLTEKIKVKDFKLNALLDVTRAINDDMSTDELLGLYESLLKDQLSIEKLILFSKHEGNWQSILKFGVGGSVPEITDDAFFENQQSIGLQMSSAGEHESFDVIIPVYHDEEPLAHLLVGDIGEQEIGVSPVIKHMKFIQTLTNIILVAIRNKSLAKENLRQEGIRKELELAAEMQAILVPTELPSTSDFDVAAVYMPHQQVGGDYYDFMDLGNNEFMFCMADVSGKGVSAAFLMSNFQSHLRAIFNYLHVPLEDKIHELNTKVMRSAMGEKYITFFVGTYNSKSRILNYINCGHNPPVYVHPDKRTELLSKGSIGLGMFEEIPSLTKGELTVSPNSTLVCYTDGLVELENSLQQEYGLERLESLIINNYNLGMDDMNKKIMQEVTDFKGEMPYIDDTALLSCRFF